MAKSSSDKPKKIEMPYGLWRSPMALEALLSQPSAPMYPFRYRGRLHWLEALTEDGGRIALMRQRESGGRRALTPAPFNIRSGAHEYGGACFCRLGDQLIFSNFSDGRLYRQALSAHSPPVAVTPAPPSGQTARFADLAPLNRLGMVIAVMESGGENRTDRDHLVAIEVSKDASHAGACTPQVLVEGSDFYACPVISPKQTQIAWMEWDNPFMPWDQSRLVQAELSAGGQGVAIRKRQVVVEMDEHAVGQPGFIDERTLVFVSDGDDADFWDFFQCKNQKIKRLTNDQYEYGEAHWLFGQRRWQGVSENKIIAVGSRFDGDSLLEIAVDSGKTTLLAEGFAACAQLRAEEIDGGELLFIASYAERDAEIRSLKFAGGLSHSDHSDDSSAAVHVTTCRGADPACSQPLPIAYPTRDGAQAHAYFYAPGNPGYRAPQDAKPPLLVMVHGGPTGRATPALNPLKQFFTSLGYAVLDINHRGSTGYGRAYRQKLLGRWGELDATDIADGVRYVLEKNWADPQLAFIRGGSAGGYAVLRALTRFPAMFSAGACYYGIGNLAALAKITHKFEGCYTDRLIGEKFDAETVYDLVHTPASRFVQRSPVFQLARLNSPLILFHGLQDNIAPPALSQEVAELLRQKGIPCDYIEYAEEGHGFRRLPNRVDSLKRETAFFAAIIQAKAGRAGDNS